MSFPPPRRRQKKRTYSQFPDFGYSLKIPAQRYLIFYPHESSKKGKTKQQ